MYGIKKLNKEVYKSLMASSKAFYDLAEYYRYETQEGEKKVENQREEFKKYTEKQLKKFRKMYKNET